MPAALSNRCYARAAAGLELDAALADCEGALAGMPKDPTALTRRGLVYWREGQFERAMSDFKAALERDSDCAPALYAKGVLEVRAGRASEGQSDLDAATESSPEVEEVFAQMGLARTVEASAR